MYRFKKLYLYIAVSALLAICAPRAEAQSAGTGALAGTVTDSTGAVIPNAQVFVTNTETNQSRTTVTGNDGTYKFALL